MYLWTLMSFTYPAFLFALGTLSIPILIHLFNFRKFKLIYFSDIRFLKEIRQETKSRSRLKHLLVLFCRLMTILFLVFAFAQPFIPKQSSRPVYNENCISIYVDNSFSMNAVNKNGNLLEDAKKKAAEILSAYGPSDRFQLLSNDFEGKHQRLVSKEAFLDLLEELKPSNSSRSLSEVIARQKDLLNQQSGKGKSIFLISDFQSSMADLDKVQNDTSIQIHLLPVTANQQSNVYIDSCWFESPIRQLGATEKLHVRIQNNSAKDLENNPIKLYLNNQQKAPSSFNVAANSSTEIILSYLSSSTGIQTGKLEINDFPISFDDSYFFSYSVAPNLSVMSIHEGENESPFLMKLFGGDSLFKYQTVSAEKMDYAALSHQQLVVLNEINAPSSGLIQSLFSFVKQGGSLLIFPAEKADPAAYKELTTRLGLGAIQQWDTVDTKVNSIQREHPVYQDVFDEKTFHQANLDLPVIFGHFSRTTTTGNREEALLKMNNGESFLSAHPLEKGMVYFCASPLQDSKSNFGKHALFVPTLYRMALLSQFQVPLAYSLGKEQLIPVKLPDAAEPLVHLFSNTTHNDQIPELIPSEGEYLLKVRPGSLEAGNYSVVTNQDTILDLSFNFDRKESVSKSLKIDELKDQITKFNLLNFNTLEISEKNTATLLSEMNGGTKLWKLCILFALLFVACEVLILRFFK